MTVQSKLWLIAAALCVAFSSTGPSRAASPCTAFEVLPGGKLLDDREEELVRAGNLATSNLTVGGKKGYKQDALVIVNVWATATYTPPNPTWFLTTIKTSYDVSYRKNKTVARGDSYRDGNTQVLRFDNSLSYSEILPKNNPIDLEINALATGPGAAGVKNATLCISIRVIGLS